MILPPSSLRRLQLPDNTTGALFIVLPAWSPCFSPPPKASQPPSPSSAKPSSLSAPPSPIPHIPWLAVHYPLPYFLIPWCSPLRHNGSDWYTQCLPIFICVCLFCEVLSHSLFWCHFSTISLFSFCRPPTTVGIFGSIMYPSILWSFLSIFSLLSG